MPVLVRKISRTIQRRGMRASEYFSVSGTEPPPTSVGRGREDRHADARRREEGLVSIHVLAGGRWAMTMPTAKTLTLIWRMERKRSGDSSSQ